MVIEFKPNGMGGEILKSLSVLKWTNFRGGMVQRNFFLFFFC